MDKPSVSMCLGCEAEFPIVKQHVNAHKNDIAFTHGNCPRHWLTQALGIPNISTKMLLSSIDKLRSLGNSIPDLRDRPDLVQFYSQGKFVQQPVAQVQPQQAALKERLQKLANIIKSI